MTQLHHIYKVLHWTKIDKVFLYIYEVFHKYDEAFSLSVVITFPAIKTNGPALAKHLSRWYKCWQKVKKINKLGALTTKIFFAQPAFGGFSSSISHSRFRSGKFFSLEPPIYLLMTFTQKNVRQPSQEWDILEEKTPKPGRVPRVVKVHFLLV